MVRTVAVLLAGGTGTRLYPASRSDRPKQFQSFGADSRSLLRRAADRAAFADDVCVLTREAYADAVREHVPEADVLVEPVAKDTGPALAYASHRVREEHADAVLCALPADHVVGDGFGEVARRGCRVAAEREKLVTFGVEPDRPATEYGYIEPGAAHDGYADVASFREKPDAETAARLREAGCLWNAGLFAWRPEVFLAEARDGPLAPLIDALDAGDPERGFDRVDPVSVDYAVMERTDRAAVVPADFDWDDLGSWDALERVLDGDGDGNTLASDALALDASGNVIASDDKHVSVVGVDDLVVAAYDDRVLVVPKADGQRVRDVVAELRGDDLF
ncbi:mannose-1-phosphate guanylyltransferase [Halarchaeum grantii]|uniref:mannose-1-phosphate guanylyltransferase n=1 Tax=Halarchaeum grantii TaxID=1193105 RepID=UPI00166DB354|nr:sugar phosphate nucleotidyltransferase [Halarchaeum grantii]